jgi:hypothetical protein
VDILKNSRQPMLAVCISDTVRQVLAVVKAGKKSNVGAATGLPRKRKRVS